MHRVLQIVLSIFAVGCLRTTVDNGILKCATDSQRQCPVGYYCAADNTCWKNGAAPTLPSKHQGDACSADGDCDTGHCVDGICCDTACTEQCQACDVGAGICTTVSGMPHGARPACPGSGACASMCTGTSTSCIYPDATNPCGAQTCGGSPPAVMSASACNGMGMCLPTGGTTSMACPTPFGATPTCNGSQCDFTCNPPYQRQGSSCISSFSSESANTGGAAVDFWTIWGSSSNDIYAAGYDNTNNIGAVYRKINNGAWAAGNAMPSGTSILTGIWGDNANDIYLVSLGYGKIFYSSGAGVFTQVQNTGTFDSYMGVWGSGNQQNVWVVGGTTSLSAGGIIDRHGPGAQWAAETSGLAGQIQLTSVWGSGDTDIYAVCSDGRIIHSAGNGTWGTPQQMSHTTNQLNGVWGADPMHIWAVGSAGTIIFTAGDGMWATQASGTTKDLYGIWGSSGGDIYAVGDGGVILHSTGDGKWQPQTSNTTTLLRAVWGTSPTNVYAVGNGGLITHFH